jgi:hypothetical protein
MRGEEVEEVREDGMQLALFAERAKSAAPGEKRNSETQDLPSKINRTRGTRHPVKIRERSGLLRKTMVGNWLSLRVLGE